MKGSWGNQILKDLKKTVATKSYLRTNYIGNGVILTRIAYEALGMREHLKPGQTSGREDKMCKEKPRLDQKDQRKKQ